MLKDVDFSEKLDLNIVAKYHSQQFFLNQSVQDLGLVTNQVWDALSKSGWLKRYGRRKGVVRLQNQTQITDILRELQDYRSLANETIDSLADNSEAQENLLLAYKCAEKELGKALGICKPTIECVSSFLSHIFTCMPVITNKFRKLLRRKYEYLKCGFSVFNQKMLQCILEFYREHKSTIDATAKNLVRIGISVGAGMIGNYAPFEENGLIPQIIVTIIADELTKWAETLYDSKKNK